MPGECNNANIEDEKNVRDASFSSFNADCQVDVQYLGAEMIDLSSNRANTRCHGPLHSLSELPSPCCGDLLGQS